VITNIKNDEQKRKQHKPATKKLDLADSRSQPVAATHEMLAKTTQDNKQTHINILIFCLSIVNDATYESIRWIDKVITPVLFVSFSMFDKAAALLIEAEYAAPHQYVGTWVEFLTRNDAPFRFRNDPFLLTQVAGTRKRVKALKPKDPSQAPIIERAALTNLTRNYPDYGAIAIFWLLSGFRRGTLTKITNDDITMYNREWIITPKHAKFWGYIAPIRISCNCSSQGSPRFCVTCNIVNKIKFPISVGTADAVAELLNVTTHSFRRTLAVYLKVLREAGLNPATIQEVFNHFGWTQSSILREVNMYTRYSAGFEYYLRNKNLLPFIFTISLHEVPLNTTRSISHSQMQALARSGHL
jgi:hypothetical protein